MYKEKLEFKLKSYLNAKVINLLVCIHISMHIRH